MLLRPCRPLLARQPNGSLPLSLPQRFLRKSLLGLYWMPTGSLVEDLGRMKYHPQGCCKLCISCAEWAISEDICTCIAHALQDMQLSHTCLRDHFEIVRRSECDLSRRSSFPRTPPPVILSNIYPNQALLSPTNLPERIAFVTTRYSAMSIYKNPTRPIPPGPYFPYIRITELPG